MYVCMHVIYKLQIPIGFCGSMIRAYDCIQEDFLGCDPHHLVESAHHLSNDERKTLKCRGLLTQDLKYVGFLDAEFRWGFLRVVGC